MSMIGEANAEFNAVKLEGIILRLINGREWSDVRSAARGIAKKELYRWYLDECSETFSVHNPHPEIVEAFKDK